MVPYRRQVRTLKAEATVQEKKLRQLSLLERGSNTKIPKEIEEKALELLVQMLIAIIPAIEGGEVDEQNQK
jgi:hypothetical protein